MAALFARTQDPLKSLPVEILCHIFDRMEMKDLLTCTLVARYFRKVIVESSRLQYTIELARHCVVSLLPSTSVVPFATRLRKIRERERGWKYLDWKRKHTLKLPPTGSVYEFVGGLYANGRENVSRITASISFLELPSTGHDPDAPLQTWTHAMDDINIIDFTMDPSQDLLVLVALAPADSAFVYELHLRSIKTNGPHPNAPVPVLSCWKRPTPPQPSSDVFAAVRIQISGCLVALLIKEVQEVGAHLEIWNWECSTPSSSFMTRNSGIDDFTFLTQDSFLLVRPTGLFEVYTFNDPAKDRTPPQLRITYVFPALSDGFMYWYISMSSNPAPGYVPRPPKNPDNVTLSNDTQIYYPRPDERIHACCLYIFEPHNEDNIHVHSFVFFLNLRTLLNPAEEWLDKARALALERKRRRDQQAAMAAMAAKLPVTANGTPAAAAGAAQESSSPTLADTAQPYGFAYHPPQTMPVSPYPLFPTYSASGSASHTGTAGDIISNNSITSGSSSSTIAPAAVLNNNSNNGNHPYRRRSHGHGHGSSIAPCQCHPHAVPKDTRRPIERVPPNTIIPWEVWGPSSTRWFEECINTDWQHAIYGLRTVESVQRTPAFGAPIPEGSIPREVASPGAEERARGGEGKERRKNGAGASASARARSRSGSPLKKSPVAASASSESPGKGASSATGGGSSSSRTATAGPTTRRAASVLYSPDNHASAPPPPAGGASQPVNAAGEGSSSGPSTNTTTSTGAAAGASANTSATASASAGANGDANAEAPPASPDRAMRYLRVRDFNPYIFTKEDAGEEIYVPDLGKTFWVEPRLVTEPSYTPSKGVFQRDILSTLPYMEVISREMFEVTDVMMDDCRMLLLKRGTSGKLERVDVLMV